MLIEITVENAALLRKARLGLSGGFCAITGQTGAGKTVFVSALGLLKGDKAGPKTVTEGEEQCRVSGVFSDLPAALLDSLADEGLADREDDCLTLTRFVKADGKSRCLINGKTVALSRFREVGGALLTLHSQHETHKLADPGTHMDYVDALGDKAHRDLVRSYAEAYESYRLAKSALEEGERQIASAKEKQGWLKETVKELSATAVKEKEEDRLWEKYRILENRSKLSAAAAFVRQAVQGGEKQKGAYDRVMLAAAKLEGFEEICPEFSLLSKKLESIGYELESAMEALEQACPEDGEEALRLMDKISQRIQKLRRLKQKYSADEAALIALLERSQEELDAAQGGESRKKRLEATLQQALLHCQSVGKSLQESRKRISDALCLAVDEKLKFLDMEKAQFFVEFTPLALPGKEGPEKGEFYIRTNAGQQAAPLGSIASGGELSRILLALKSVFAAEQERGVLIFDEIDTGISGKTARKIGLLLRQLSRHTQIIAVTHSAQIASLAKEHFLLQKEVEDNQTVSRALLLTEEERVEELSRILGGMEITDAVRQNARELLQEP